MYGRKTRWFLFCIIVIETYLIDALTEILQNTCNAISVNDCSIESV
ncbi:hypothetical protein A1OE_376 [Candidatus Endolissoclinum faulkneri L2]|uniref:Uncharacterized protein n=1 Tax=Candidatus Endolissoclinum faulkneri L2 TaxID=1193729 RepID=K7ZCH0_9PROT|nr:hypothetical protein A1OE_376 [Candidatus Endolissoclinum faulkneri L2]